MKNLTKVLSLNPCQEAVTFIKQCDSFKQAWETCPRGDWMLWLASMLNVNIRTLTLAKGLCAQTVIHLMADQRSVYAVEAAILFGKGQLSLARLNSAARAAYTAYAAYAAYAARAAYAAANTAANAAYASYVAKLEDQLKTAEICREILTTSVYWHINRLHI